jgi:hypothetical protein
MDRLSELLHLLFAFVTSTNSTRCRSPIATGHWQLMSLALSDYVTIPTYSLIPYPLMLGRRLQLFRRTGGLAWAV